MKYPVLNYKESMHEQREMMFGDVVPEVGWWVEEGKFTPIIESFAIHTRWQCTNREETLDDEELVGRIVVRLKKRDLDADLEESRRLAERVVAKHGELLAASLLKCIVKGASANRELIAKECRNPDPLERFAKRVELLKKPDDFDKWETEQIDQWHIQRNLTKIEKHKSHIRQLEEKNAKILGGNGAEVKE
jgi:hypothetical protein